MDMTVSLRKSRESRDQRLRMPAPRTLRTPSSFVRCSATKAARPNRPRQEMKMASRITAPDRGVKPGIGPTVENALAAEQEINRALLANDAEALGRA